MVCDISAFQYWRVPPVVRLLASAPEGDEDLGRLFTFSQVEALRTEMAQELSLCRSCLGEGTRWRRTSDISLTIRDASVLLASTGACPIDVLVKSSSEAHRSSIVRQRQWKHDVAPGALMPIADELAVASPAFALQQLAARASLVRTIMLASEACGSFSIYRAPAPLARFLQRKIDIGCLPNYGGWSPCITPSGKLTDLWSHKPFTTPEELSIFARLSDSDRGRKRLLRAAELVRPNAASPFEAQTGMLLGLPKRLGGEGLGSFEHNKRIELSGQARLLADKDCCYGDLVWDQCLDLECQGAKFHDNSESYLSDSERTGALELMGYRVLPTTYNQIADPARFEALADIVAKILGVRRTKKSEASHLATLKLRNELFSDWHRIPFV